jgi:hypothetical protein
MSTAGSKKAIIAALLANLGIAIAKFVGFLIISVSLEPFVNHIIPEKPHWPVPFAAIIHIRAVPFIVSGKGWDSILSPEFCCIG